jgi:hypothetical protein
MRKPPRLRFSILTLLASAIVFAAAPSQATPPAVDEKAAQKPDPKSIAEVDAGLGPCTADFTITDEAGAPVYAANIRVHIAYGFANLHKFDLQVGTNADGKARFIGLPENSKQGFFFRASEGEREGSAFDNPAKTCKAQFTIVLRKKP